MFPRINSLVTASMLQYVFLTRNFFFYLTFFFFFITSFYHTEVILVKVDLKLSQLQNADMGRKRRSPNQQLNANDEFH